MQPYLDKDIPIVAIHNNVESFFEFLNRTEDPSVVQRMQYKGDRALLWLGDPKLVFVTLPISHAEHLCQLLGYQGTRFIAPENPSPWLSLDILRESPLITRLVEYAGAERTLQLVPYAATRQFFQLTETLRTEYGLNVLLPESPSPECLWLRDYIDTKAGFRLLVSRWLSNSVELLPQGFICRDRQQAAEVAYWFGTNGQDCIIKPDGGESQLGHHILHPGDFSAPEDILRELDLNPFLSGDSIIVEEFIHSSVQLFPSVELFVPPLGSGSPEITYPANQLFLECGGFCGVLVSRELLDTNWYPSMAEGGLLIATRLQEMGYVGHFDLDAIVDDQGRVSLLEVNSRRTGGTHVHEFARFFFGLDYLSDVVLLDHQAMGSGAITRFDHLLQVIGDLLYPMQHGQRGVIVTVTSTLAVHKFGCIIVAPSAEEALALQQALTERIYNASEQ